VNGVNWISINTTNYVFVNENWRKWNQSSNKNSELRDHSCENNHCVRQGYLCCNFFSVCLQPLIYFPLLFLLPGSIAMLVFSLILFYRLTNFTQTSGRIVLVENQITERPLLSQDSTGKKKKHETTRYRGPDWKPRTQSFILTPTGRYRDGKITLKWIT
jgi:hypothetical protein